jgi:hypothetical protein
MRQRALGGKPRALSQTYFSRKPVRQKHVREILPNRAPHALFENLFPDVPAIVRASSD